MANSIQREAVLWPLGRRMVQGAACAPRLPDLNGRTVVELWDEIFRGEKIFPLVRAHLRARYPDVRIVEYGETGNFYGAREERDQATRLPALIRSRGGDAAVIGIGA